MNAIKELPVCRD